MKENLTRLLNSFLLLFLAYLLIHSLFMLVQVPVLKALGISDVTVYLTGVFYDINTIENWTRNKVLAIYGFPVFFVFGVFLFLWLYASFTKIKSIHPLVLLNWLITVALCFFIASFIRAPFYYKGLNVVFKWFYIQDEFIYFIALLSVPFIPLLAFITHRRFLKTANSRNWLKTKNKRSEYLIYVGLLPVLLFVLVWYALFAMLANYNMFLFLENEGFVLIILLVVQILNVVMVHNNKYISVKKHSSFSVFRFDFTTITSVVIALIILVLFIGI